MKRLTERDEFGNADIIGVDSEDLQCNLTFDEFNIVTDAMNKLADYEDLEEKKKSASIKRPILNRMRNAVMQIYMSLSEEEMKSLQAEIEFVTETNCDYKIYDIAHMLKSCVDTAVNGI